MAKFEATFVWERYIREVLKKPELSHLTGFRVFETHDEDDDQFALAVVLGPINGGRRGRKPSAIPLAMDEQNRPLLRGDRLIRADIDTSGETLRFVRQQKEDVALRTFRTGLFQRRGSTLEDQADLFARGEKLRYHGVFPISADAAKIVGEGIDLEVTAQSRVVVDERIDQVKGMAGVSRLRETTIEGVVHGPVLVGEINGTLVIHELRKGGWKKYDVTADPDWQKTYLDLVTADAQYLADVEKAAADMKKREKKFRVIKAPADYDG